MFKSDTPDIDCARRALCAWCSIPDKKTAAPKEEWQFSSDFSDLHREFPELVDAKGQGWFYSHVHKIERFIAKNSDIMSKAALAKAEPLKKGFDAAWRAKVKQYQVSLYSTETKGAWVLRFDDILADALELGPLADKTVSFTDDVKECIKALLPDGLPYEVAETVIAYCIANKPDDSDYVILPYAFCEQIGKETLDISDEIPFDIPDSWEWVLFLNTWSYNS
jgi:hypothetical protein